MVDGGGGGSIELEAENATMTPGANMSEIHSMADFLLTLPVVDITLFLFLLLL